MVEKIGRNYPPFPPVKITILFYLYTIANLSTLLVLIRIVGILAQLSCAHISPRYPHCFDICRCFARPDVVVEALLEIEGLNLEKCWLSKLLVAHREGL